MRARSMNDAAAGSKALQELGEHQCERWIYLDVILPVGVEYNKLLGGNAKGKDCCQSTCSAVFLRMRI